MLLQTVWPRPLASLASLEGGLSPQVVGADSMETSRLAAGHVAGCRVERGRIAAHVSWARCRRSTEEREAALKRCFECTVLRCLLSTCMDWQVEADSDVQEYRDDSQARAGQLAARPTLQQKLPNTWQDSSRIKCVTS